MPSQIITVREYAVLTTDVGYRALDRHSIPQSVYNWLLVEQTKFYKSGVPILEMEGKRSLKLGSHVGLLQSPCGTQIEILPKTTLLPPDEEGIRTTRQKVCEMILTYLGKQEREYGPAALQLFKRPISEFIISQFLSQLNMLVRKGMKHVYLRVDEESRYLRGQLRVAQQVRQPISRSHHFQISHDIFTVDRPENRLLRKGLETVISLTRDPDNWRLANELFHQTHEIPASRNIHLDFKSWSNDRLMENYQSIKLWVELILYKQNPTSQMGDHTGIALLFPMEYLFEDYVAHQLHKQCNADWRLKAQTSTKHLCEDHCGKTLFQLKPDLLVICKTENKCHVLDTKWKILNSSLSGNRDKFGISQSDIYQMFAYGQKYMDGSGDMMMIYPKNDEFEDCLPVFVLDKEKGLNLWVVPFDLHNKSLILPANDSKKLVFKTIFASKNDNKRSNKKRAIDSHEVLSL